MGAPPVAQKISRPFRPRGRNGGFAPVRDRKALVAALERGPDRFGSAAFVVALLQEKSWLLPDSVCGNLVFKESLEKEKGLSPWFCLCYHLFSCPAPRFSAPLMPRDSGRPVSQAVSEARWIGLRDFGG
jgi:hypothetical protein